MLEHIVVVDPQCFVLLVIPHDVLASAKKRKKEKKKKRKKEKLNTHKTMAILKSD